MMIRASVTAMMLVLSGFAFWDGALGSGYALNPFGILFLAAAGAVWFGWRPLRESFKSARDESDIPIIRLNTTLIDGMISSMKPAPPARKSSSS